MANPRGYKINPARPFSLDASPEMHKYAFMRTTLDLPDALARRAKLAAASRGVTLKTLMMEALARELDGPVMRTGATLELPLIKSRQPGTMNLTPEALHEILAREESATYEVSRRR